MRVLNDNNQWVGDGQIIDRECECLMHRKLGPAPWYPYRSQKEADRARDKFVSELVEQVKRRMAWETSESK